MGYDRIQRVIWSDILMSQEHSAVFTYEKVKMAGPTTIPARPAIYKVTIAKTGDATANDTLVIGGQTFTAKSTPSTSSGTTDFALDATASSIATIVKNKGLTNYTVTCAGDTVTFTQTTPGTGNAVTIGTGTGTATTATVENTQEYVPANSTNPEYNIEPGEPLYLVSIDTDGVKTVAPIDITNATQVNAFCGFNKERFNVKKDETISGAIMARKGCELDLNLLPASDQFGNPISYDYTTGSLREKAEEKEFIFGRKKT